MSSSPRKTVKARFSHAWARMFSTSVFARFVSLYERANARLRDGLFHRANLLSLSGKRRVLRLKGAAARQIDESFLAVFWKRCVHFLLSLRVRCVGLFFFVFGVINCLIYLSSRFLPRFLTADPKHLIFGVFITLASLPLFRRRRSLAASLKQSRLLSAFLEKAVLLRENEFPTLHAQSADAFCILSGLILGLLSLFFNPFRLLGVLLMLIFVALAFYKPEFGAAALLFLFPFLSQTASANLLIFLFAALMLKVLRGKRTLRFELIGLSAGIFSAFLLLCGLFSILPANQNASLLFVGALSFFFVSNLSGRREVFTVLLALFVLGATASSVMRLGFHFLPDSLFTGGARLLLRTLTDHASLYFTLCALPLALLFSIRGESALGRLFFFTCLFALLADLWLYASLAAALTALACTALLLAVSSRKMFLLVLVLALATLVALPLIEGAQTEFLWTALSERSPSIFVNQSRLPQGSFLFGIGAFSPEALTALNLSDSLSGSLTFYSQFLLAVGIFGLLVFLLFLLFAMQKSTHYYLTSPYNPKRLFAIAPLFSILALLIIGLTRNLFADARAFSLIFVFAAALSSLTQTLSREDNVILDRF